MVGSFIFIQSQPKFCYRFNCCLSAEKSPLAKDALSAFYNPLCLSMQKRRRYVVAIAHASFCSVSCDHTMAGVIEQQSCQQVIGFVARDSTVGPLGSQF